MEPGKLKRKKWRDNGKAKHGRQAKQESMYMIRRILAATTMTNFGENITLNNTWDIPSTFAGCLVRATLTSGPDSPGLAG